MKNIQMFLMLFMCLAGCQKNIQQKQKKQQEQVAQKVEIDPLQETIARLSDIPDVPMSTTMQKIEQSDRDLNQVQIFCDVGSVGWKELCDYYENEMERLGWSLQGRCDLQVGLIVFVKPSGSLCVISMRSQKGMVITLLKKKD